MPPPAPRGDTDVVEHTITRRIAAGDESAYARFYEAWFEPTLVLARACSRRDESFCLDVVQDVMLAVARRMPALRDANALRSWMSRAVMHAVTDRVRSEARRWRREQQAAERQSRSPLVEPWLELMSRERHAWLDTNLRALSATDRALVLARFGDVSSVTAAAEELGLTADAAHGRLRRVLIRLRQKSEEWFRYGS